MNTALVHPTPTKAPHFDRLLQVAKAQPIVVKDCDKSVLMQIFQTMTVIAADAEHDDYRDFWFCLDRGTIKDFGSYREYKKNGEVDNREQFEETWLYHYPDAQHWYHFATNQYNGEYYFSIESELTFHLAKEIPQYYGDIDNSELLTLLNELVNYYCDWIVKDNAGYNRFLNEKLSYNRRYGKILRKDYWKINPDEKKMIAKGLTKKGITVLAKIVAQSADDCPLPGISEMTAGKFFAFCRLGYDANGYFKKRPDISNVDAYRAFSDGRDDGLKEINPDSIEEFTEWFTRGEWRFGHPWEVCRGGNSTHISLFVSRENSEWKLRLAGSASSRVNETVKFAIALYNNHIPFKLSQSVEIYKMVTGADYIGIVPKEVFPRYCHSLFPKEDGIIDFMRLDWEDTDKIVEATEWYPVEIKANNKE
ncbi:MAG: hypothetical protein LBN93_04600 [Candidatus Symbiothrix sp.]|jgi:hypothetical protein|nr:hypothetical protein [Candidatus Symbiothrix sp.]